MRPDTPAARDQVAAIAGRLIALGRLSDTPAIAVENAGHPQARTNRFKRLEPYLRAPGASSP